MARAIKEIKKSMTDQFMASSELSELYGFRPGASFDEVFSSVSLESILFGIFASAIYVLETFFYRFKSDVDSKIASAIVATIPWYHRICKEYQHGDDLVYDESTASFKYQSVDVSKQLVKYASCRDRGGGVYILVSGEDQQGLPAALPDDVLQAFRSYINEVKPAGVIVEAYSYDPDVMTLSAVIEYDPLVLNSDGSLLSDSSIYPVEAAIERYLQNILYGGVLNKTKLVDAIQSAEGVKDVILNSVMTRQAKETEFTVMTGNNYSSVGGSFIAENLRKGISYELQI